jgi:hypothetical protein
MDATVPAVIYLAGIASWTYHFWSETLQAFLYWPLAAVVVPHFVISLRKDMHAIRASLLALVAALSVFLVGFVMLNHENLSGSWIIYHSGIFGIYFFLGNLDYKDSSKRWQLPFLYIGRIGILIMSFILTYRTLWNFDIIKLGNFSDPALWLNSILLLGIMAIYAFLLVKNRKLLETEDVLYGAMPLVSILAYITNFFIGPLVAVPIILFNIYILGFSLSNIVNGMKQNRLDKLNAGIFILVILIVLRFFDIDIGFVFKGLVFIALGIGFLAVNVIMLRRREVKYEK